MGTMSVDFIVMGRLWSILPKSSNDLFHPHLALTTRTRRLASTRLSARLRHLKQRPWM